MRIAADSKATGLVMDLGVSDGNDTAFYLAKGFRVVAVEADPDVCKKLRARFAEHIESGALILLNRAASNRAGETLKIFVHKQHQGLSGTAKRPDVRDEYDEYFVETIDWPGLLAQAGVPRYVKIDIEGHEPPFLKGMAEHGSFPEFISVECYTFDVIDMLRTMGYARFKLVDQTRGFALPVPQREGHAITKANFRHSSGPFGLDVFRNGDWLDADTIEPAWLAVLPSFDRTWYDCHAWMPKDAVADGEPRSPRRGLFSWLLGR